MHAYSKDLCLFYKCMPATKSEESAVVPIENETEPFIDSPKNNNNFYR